MGERWIIKLIVIFCTRGITGSCDLKANDKLHLKNDRGKNLVYSKMIISTKPGNNRFV